MANLQDAVQIDRELLGRAMRQIDFGPIEDHAAFIDTFFEEGNAAAAPKYIETGEFFEGIGNLHKASLEYARAIKLDGSQPDYHQRLAELSFAIGEVDSSINHLQDAITADERKAALDDEHDMNPTLYVRAGTAYKRKAERVS